MRPDPRHVPMGTLYFDGKEWWVSTPKLRKRLWQRLWYQDWSQRTWRIWRGYEPLSISEEGDLIPRGVIFADKEMRINHYALEFYLEQEAMYGSRADQAD